MHALGHAEAIPYLYILYVEMFILMNSNFRVTGTTILSRRSDVCITPAFECYIGSNSHSTCGVASHSVFLTVHLTYFITCM